MKFFEDLHGHFRPVARIREIGKMIEEEWCLGGRESLTYKIRYVWLDGETDGIPVLEKNIKKMLGSE